MSLEQRLLIFVQKHSGGMIRTPGEAKLFLVALCVFLILLSAGAAWSSATAKPPVDEAAAARAKMPPPPLSERRRGTDF